MPTFGQGTTIEGTTNEIQQVSGIKGNEINFGPFNIYYFLNDSSLYSIQKLGSGYSRNTGHTRDSFNIYEHLLKDIYDIIIWNNQNKGIITIEIIKYSFDRDNLEYQYTSDRSTMRIEKEIKDILTSQGYDNISITSQLISGYPGLVGIGIKEGNVVYLADFWMGQFSKAIIQGNLPKEVMESFFNSVKISEQN